MEVSDIIEEFKKIGLRQIVQKVYKIFTNLKSLFLSIFILVLVSNVRCCYNHCKYMGHQNAIGGKSPLQAKAHSIPPFCM